MKVFLEKAIIGKKIDSAINGNIMDALIETIAPENYDANGHLIRSNLSQAALNYLDESEHNVELMEHETLPLGTHVVHGSFDLLDSWHRDANTVRNKQHLENLFNLIQFPLPVQLLDFNNSVANFLIVIPKDEDATYKQLKYGSCIQQDEDGNNFINVTWKGETDQPFYYDLVNEDLMPIEDETVAFVSAYVVLSWALDGDEDDCLENVLDNHKIVHGKPDVDKVLEYTGMFPQFEKNTLVGLVTRKQIAKYKKQLRIEKKKHKVRG